MPVWPRPPIATSTSGPPGEWLLDNFHVVQEHIREVRESLPRGYYRELPELAGGGLAGYPRVYELAITLISHTEGRIDLENVDLFVEAFQRVSLALDRRAVGGAGDAAARPDRERPPDGAAHGAAARRGRIGRPVGGASRRQRAGADRSAARSTTSSPTLRRSPPSSSRDSCTSSGSRAAPSRPCCGSSAGSPKRRSTPRMPPRAHPAARADARHDGEQHHQSAGIALRDWRTFVERQSVMEAALREDPSGVTTA